MRGADTAGSWAGGHRARGVTERTADSGQRLTTEAADTYNLSRDRASEPERQKEDSLSSLGDRGAAPGKGRFPYRTTAESASPHCCSVPASRAVQLIRNVHRRNM